jgi:hypothetical protein
VDLVATDEAPIEVRFSEAIVAPEIALSLFAHLAALSAQQLAVIDRWLQTAHLTLSSKDNEATLAEALEERKPSELAGKLVLAYFRLESSRRALNWSAEQFIGYLSEIYNDEQKEAGKPPLDENTRKSLVSLFGPREMLDLLYKARRIYDGCLPSFVNCFTTVDFRPVFSDDAAFSIRHGLISTILELVVRKPDETAETQRIAVQIDAKDIETLEAVLSRAKAKIARIREFSETKEGIRLFNPRIALKAEEKP